LHEIEFEYWKLFIDKLLPISDQEERNVEMKLSVGKARERAVALMYRGYH
jgi:hypothetical protein